MTSKDNDIKGKLEPTGTNGEAQLITGRVIDLSVAISLKRIADKLTVIANALQRPRR